MGKDKHLAASVPWASLQAAIAANPHRSMALPYIGNTASASVMTAATVEEVPVPWLSGWTEDTTFTVSDAVSFALWIKDPMYRSAVPSVRRTMEMEEAGALLNASETAWRDYNGRARGWVRKHLEEDLRSRSAGEAPVPNAWAEIRTNKRAAHLMDYVCIMRGLRVALWWPEDGEGYTTVFPLTGGGSAPIVQLNCLSGHVLLGPTGFSVSPADWQNFFIRKDVTDRFKWHPPASAPAAGSLTVAQIQERIRDERKALGLADMTIPGNRTTLWLHLQWLVLSRDFVTSTSTSS